jgi:3-oxoacyl-[acyl-carrier-protein] synthase II
MKIWVTGIGIVSPLAPTSRATMARLCDAEHAFRQVTLFDVSGQRSQIAAEVPDLRVADVVPRAAQADEWSRTDALAILAAREALAEARLSPARDPVDLVLGTTTGATFETEELLPDLLIDGSSPRLTPAIVHPLSLTVEHVAGALGPFRRRRLVSSACSTGANALLLAASWLRSGISDCVLAGASDSLCRLTYTGFNALGSLDTEPCRPFDASRAGLGLGEGAAFLVLEREAHARARGAHPIAELVGWAAGAEAHHITNPESEGTVATRTMTRALQCAGLHPADIDYVNAHGTATLLNDPMEVHAIRSALGDAFDRVLISSIKGQIGHSLGAAGAVEAAVTALAIHQGQVPPTVGLTQPAHDCVANHVIRTPRTREIRAAMSNSFGFGGLDGVIVIARPGFAPDVDHVARTLWVRGGAVALHDEVRATDDPWLEPADVPSGPLGDTVTATLDPSRSRRLARAERLLASVVEAVHLPANEGTTGIVVGKASGNPDATSRFLDRVRQRGPRFASPADFPNLMLSSLAGHVSIYHRFQGLALATSAFNHPGTSCILTACELLASGIPDRLFAAAVEPWGMIAKAHTDRGCPWAEGAAAVLLDTDPVNAIARVKVLDLLATDDWPGPGPKDRVLWTDGIDLAILRDTPWNGIPAFRAEDFVGCNDASQVAAVVIAASWVAVGSCERALVLLADNGGAAVLSVESP